MPSVAIVTCYHFNKIDKKDAYSRLIKSLTASFEQLEALGCESCLILVANGIDENAAAPEEVVTDLESRLQRSCRSIVHVPIRINCGNTGALNQGIDAALHRIPAIEWIASVQSSAVICGEWLSNVVASGSAESSIGGSFGRVLLEEDQSSIWTDGHFLKGGRTYDANNLRGIGERGLCPPGQFPCLSASLFRKTLVEKIWSKYGNFLCENLPHYGDCTDVALRARAVDPSVRFKYSESAFALKRRPEKNDKNIATSQLLAASLYYDQSRRKEAEQRLRSKGDRNLANAKVDADQRSKKQYAPISTTPPCGTLLDIIW